MCNNILYFPLLPQNPVSTSSILTFSQTFFSNYLEKYSPTRRIIKFECATAKFTHSHLSCMMQFLVSTRAANHSSVSQLVFTITKKAPTRAFSWIKEPLRYIHSIFVPPSQSNDIAKKSAFKPKRGHESTTGIHLIDE